MKRILAILTLAIGIGSSYSAEPTRSLQVYSSAASLLNVNPTNSLIQTNVFVEGVLAPADGHAGILTYYPSSTATTNQYDCLKPNVASGRWIRGIQSLNLARATNGVDGYLAGSDWVLFRTNIDGLATTSNRVEALNVTALAGLGTTSNRVESLNTTALAGLGTTSNQVAAVQSGLGTTSNRVETLNTATLGGLVTTSNRVEALNVVSLAGLSTTSNRVETVNASKIESASGIGTNITLRGISQITNGTAAAPSLFANETIIGETWTGTTMRRDQGNPLFANLFEPSVLIEGDTARLWSLNGYATATDASCRVWSSFDPSKMPEGMVRTNGGTFNFPYVIKEAGTYYCIMAGGAASGQENLYMWSSSDGLAWTRMNAGNPVLTNSTSTASYSYNIYNPAIAFVGTNLHLLVEGRTSTSQFQLLYSVSSLAAGPNFNTSLTGPIVNAAGNAWLTYVPDRSALLTVYGDLSSGTWKLLAKTALLSSDLTLPASWVDAPGFRFATPSVHEADPALAFTSSTNKTFKCLLMWNTYQQAGAQAYAQLSLDDFFDLATSPDTFNSGNFASTKIEALKVNIGGLDTARLGADTNGLTLNSGLRVAGFQTNEVAPTFNQFKATVTDTVTNNLSIVGYLTHFTSGGLATANNMGVGLDLYAYNSLYATTNRIARWSGQLYDQSLISGYTTISTMLNNALVDRVKFGYNLSSIDTLGGSINAGSVTNSAMTSQGSSATDALRIQANAAGLGANVDSLNVGRSAFSILNLNGSKTVINSGNLAIGSTNAQSMLTVGTGQEFQVNSAGNLTTLGSITASSATTPIFNLQDSAPSSFADLGYFVHLGTGATLNGIGGEIWIKSTNSTYSNTAKLAGFGGLFTDHAAIDTAANIAIFSGNAVTNMFRLTKTGLGLGKTNPATMLDVSGTVTATDFAGPGTSLTGTGSSFTAGAATILATARTINGTSFDGSANITVPAAAGTLTGATLASGVTTSSLTSFGTTPTLVTPTIQVSDATPAGVSVAANFNHLSTGTTANGVGASVNLRTTNTTYSMMTDIARFGAILTDVIGINGAATISTMTANSMTEKLRVMPSGRVGLGNTNPATMLDVSGTVTATDFAGPGTSLTGTGSSFTAGAATLAANSTQFNGLTTNQVVATNRTISTTAPLAGGGALNANLTLSMAASTDSVDGYMTAADHALLTGKLSKSIWTTKGDILSATGSATPARLPVGSNGQILIADSAAAGGLTWTNAPSGGGSGTVGTVINSGTPASTAVPVYSGTTGTNITPSSVTISAGAVTATSFSGAGTGLTGTGSSYTAGFSLSTPASGLSGATLASGVTSAPGLTNLGTLASLVVSKTITAPGTTGNQTINKLAGRVNIAAGQTAITVTDSLVDTNSIVLAVSMGGDLIPVGYVTPSAGQFIISLQSAVTTEQPINFLVVN